MAYSEQTTGILRGDIKLLKGESLLLFDPASEAYYKISERFAGIISCFSEDISYEAMLKKLRYNGIETGPDELHEVCTFLRINGLLIPRYGEMTLRREQLEKQKEKTLLLRLSTICLFLKLPPVHPENFFRKIAPFVSFLAAPWSLVLWSIPALWGYILALRDFGTVLEQFADTLSWAGLVKYVLAIVAVKILHEFAHSLAAIRQGCRVRGIGLGFIFFMPRLYTDTTDSWRLPRKKRLLIDGAGIIAELMIGGIAALFWNFLPPGTGRSTMFYIFAVSTLSTLLVNGNIFIRYDGYYILSDILGIENLMKRSSECVRQTWRWYFLRLGVPSAEKRKLLLISYGISAFIYRVFLYTSICLLIYCSFTKVLAILLLALEIYSILLYPLAQEIKTIYQLSRRSTGKAVWIMLFLLITIIGSILFIPLAWGITVPGESVPAWRRLVTVEESGYSVNALPARNRKIKAGECLLELKSPRLQFAIDKISKMLEYDRELFIQQELDEKEFALNEVTAKKIESDHLALKELLRRKKNLVIKADQSGHFVPVLPDISPGALIKRNTVIGEIVSERNIIYAYASDEQVGKVHPGQRGGAVMADDLTEIPCRVIKIEPVAVKFKSSPVLQPFGGPIAVYKTGNDEFISVQAQYLIVLEVPSDIRIASGRLLRVKLLYNWQLYTYIKKLILSFFRKEF